MGSFHQVTAFNYLLNTNWANVEQLSTAIKILAAEYEFWARGNGYNDKHTAGIFAVRSGGHQLVARAASIKDGA